METIAELDFAPLHYVTMCQCLSVWDPVDTVFLPCTLFIVLVIVFFLLVLLHLWLSGYVL